MSTADQKPKDKKIRDIDADTGQLNVNITGSLTSGTGLIAALIILVCAAVFTTHWPALSAEALSFDDTQYLTENLLVKDPGWTSARRFLTEVFEPSTVRGYYQPLAMISLMLDYAMGGRSDYLRPFHRTSLILHTLNTVLIIVLLYMLFHRIWIASGVGLLFGLHPMTVETIPWVGERKTLLAAFFALWCLILYVRFIRKSSWKLYIGCVVMYILAVMSKPISLPLPALMLLIDFWPKKRLGLRAIIEKLPLFAIAGIFAVITYISQSRTANVALPTVFSPLRIPLILCHNIIFYFSKIICPVNLSSHYAFPKELGLSNPMVLFGVIGTFILISLLLISLRWTRGALTGWLFFFVAILPAMQIIGFSNVIASDKFTYLPSVGLLMALTGLLCWICNAGRGWITNVTLAIIILVLAGAEAIATRRCLVHWRDTESLYEHMISITPNEAILYNDLGIALYSEDRVDDAISLFNKALELDSDLVKAHINLGVALVSKDKLTDAAWHFRKALQIDPNKALTLNNLAGVFKIQGRLDEAIEYYYKALQIDPDHYRAYYNIAEILSEQGKSDQAVVHYRQVIRINPNFADAYYYLGNILQAQGKIKEAVDYYRRLLELEPNKAVVHYNLALMLKSQGMLDEAVEHYRKALRIEPNDSDTHNNLGNALKLQGKIDEAIEHYRQALRIDPDYSNARRNLKNALQQREETKP